MGYKELEGFDATNYCFEETKYRNRFSYREKPRLQFEVDGLHVSVEGFLDEDPHIDWLGKYTDNPRYPEYAIERNRRDHREYKYFENEDYFDGSIPIEDAIKYQRQDYEVMEDYTRGGWFMLGISAKVSYAGVVLGEFTLWGIESNYSEHHAEVANNCVSLALAEAKQKIEEVKKYELVS